MSFSRPYPILPDVSRVTAMFDAVPHSKQMQMFKVLMSEYVDADRIFENPEGVRSDETLLSIIAKCRDVFPAPTRGSGLESLWADSMISPECVPAYLERCVAVDSGRKTYERTTPKFSWLQSAEGDHGVATFFLGTPDEIDVSLDSFGKGLALYRAICGMVAEGN